MIKKKEKERELAGNDLYTVSEELKKVSSSLETRSAELTSLSLKRVEEEKRIAAAKAEHSAMMVKLIELRAKGIYGLSMRFFLLLRCPNSPFLPEKSLYEEISKLNLQLFKLKTNKTDSDEIKIVRNALKKVKIIEIIQVVIQ